MDHELAARDRDALVQLLEPDVRDPELIDRGRAKQADLRAIGEAERGAVQIDEPERALIGGRRRLHGQQDAAARAARKRHEARLSRAPPDRQALPRFGEASNRRPVVGRTSLAGDDLPVPRPRQREGHCGGDGDGSKGA